MVEEVGKSMQGGAGLGDMEADSLQKILFRFGMTSEKLRETISEMTNWLASPNPPWAAYRAFMACRLVEISKGSPYGILQIEAATQQSIIAPGRGRASTAPVLS